MSDTLQRGFTLIEVMITVAIVAIIAAVALPSYSSYMQRSRVPVALDGLSAYTARMEQRYQDVGHYANGTACWAPLPTVTNFAVTCVLAGPVLTVNQGFIATATGSGPMAGYTYTINHQGVRATTAHPRGAVATCWSTRGAVCDG